MPTLTKRQKQILEYLQKHIESNGYAPTVEEIRKRFKLSAVSTVHQHLKTLEDKNFIKRDDYKARSIELIAPEKPMPSTISVPILGTITAGQPIEEISVPQGHITLARDTLSHGGKFFALKVEGDSMIDEGIFGGDTVIIHSQPNAENGQTVVAVIDDGETTLKKLYKEKNTFRLQPANPKLKPIFRKEIQVRGVVVKVLRNFEKNSAKPTFQTAIFPRRPKGQLLKWVGNKFRFSNEIVGHFPRNYKSYFEPFVGTGAVLATLQPQRAIAGDTLKPLIDLWKLVQKNPAKVANYYKKMWNQYQKDPKYTYLEIRNSYNSKPNGLDLLFLSRSCYGGVIRFTKEGKMSTPIGAHKPISPQKFSERLTEWREAVKNCTFIAADYKEIFKQVGKDDLVYCDPPYKDSQSILYGAQNFSLNELVDEIAEAKKRGAKIALSIDGIKKSGKKNIDLNIRDDVFENEILIDSGHAMLRRFQKNGEQMHDEKVKERLLLTW
jgi:DNA adenine methylase